jgi:DNA primase
MLKGNNGTPRGLDFVKLLEELAGLVELTLPQTEWTPEEIERESKLETRRSILQAVTTYLQEKIPEHVFAYLSERGFDNEAVKDLGVGFYSSVKDVTDYLKKNGYDLQAARDAGVLWRKWEGYVIFPWLDEYGRLLTLYGTWQAKQPPFKKDVPAWKRERDKAFEEWNRLLDDEKLRLPWEEPPIPKKLALPNLKGGEDILEHSKRSPLYFDRARKAGHKHVVLVEGVTDAALAQVEGDTRGVACVAAGFSHDQVDTLKRFGIDKVTICLDPDQGGASGTASCVRMLEEAGIKPLIAPELPEGLDPDDFIIKYGIDKWKAHIDAAKTPLQAEIKAIAETKPEDLLKLSARLEPIKPKLAKLPGTELEGYLELIKKTFGLKADFMKEFRREITKTKPDNAEPESSLKDEFTASLPGLVEICQDEEGRPVFLMLNGSAELETLSCVPNGCGVYVPPPKENMKWLLPRALEVQRHFRADSDEVLFRDLVEYHQQISEMPSERHYEMLAAWDVHTYLFDKSDYSPYVWLYAIPERGKTRTGKGCIYVARRGLHVESLRDAYLIRVAQDLNATLFFDVLNVQKKAEQNGSDDILMLRYEKGATVPRVLYPDRGAHRDTKYFSIYGATLIATNEHLGDIFATRAVQVTMPESDRTFDKDVKPEDGLELKERLTAFRARHLLDELPEVTKPCKGRLGDILRPLVQAVMLAAPECKEGFTAFCRELEEERHEALADTFEAKLIEAIEALDEQVYDGKLDAGKITETINAGKPERFQKVQNTITRTLKSMGFKTKRSHGTTWVEIDSSLLEKLRTRYCTHTPGKSAPSEPIVHSEENQEFSGNISGTETGQKSESVPANGDGCFSVPGCVPKVHPVSNGNEIERTEGTEGTQNQRVYAPTCERIISDEESEVVEL